MMRDKKEIETVAKKLLNTLSTVHTLEVLSDGIDCVGDIKDCEDRIEALGAEGMTAGDNYQWGMIAGKHIALRWVLGVKGGASFLSRHFTYQQWMDNMRDVYNTSEDAKAEKKRLERLMDEDEDEEEGEGLK